MQRDESSSAIKPGVPVEVIDGLARGLRGTVREEWPRHFAKGVRLWVVRFPDSVRQRVLREDYLRAVTS